MSVSFIAMLLAFAVLFILLFLRVNLALSILVCSLILAFPTLSLDNFTGVFVDVLFDLKTIELAITVSLITIFGFYY